jgi:hypothetical protein
MPVYGAGPRHIRADKLLSMVGEFNPALTQGAGMSRPNPPNNAAQGSE